MPYLVKNRSILTNCDRHCPFLKDYAIIPVSNFCNNQAWFVQAGVLMNAATVLLIGRSQVQNKSLSKALKKRFNVLIAGSRAQAVEIALQQHPHVIVLDAVSLRTPGDRICRELQDALGPIPIVHIRPGNDAVESTADVLISQPYTSRKLINSIERLVKFSDDEIVVGGPFSLNVSRRILVAHGVESQVTPKVALLMEVFLSEPGKIFDRKTLMERVWNTDYIGDTRTLDVHIRWIRQIIELDSSRPQYLKTVRGVGYCLELSESVEILMAEPVMDLLH